MRTVADQPASAPRVVVVGCGFGGFFCARALKSAPVDVVAVDRNNHLFQPLLYQVANAARSPAAPEAGFQYKDLGSMATIGKSRAVVEIGSLRLSGFLAWRDGWCCTLPY